MSQELKRGCTLERRGDRWIVWAAVGFTLYVGDAAGALAYIESKELS